MLCAGVLVLYLAISAAGQSSASCHLIVLSAELSSGDQFEKAIGEGLVFRLNPERLGPKGELDGWAIQLFPAASRDHDYIYPVNPPLRFNGLQTLGPSYGDDTKASLRRAHEMRFLLHAADYDRISALVTYVLWPYSAPNPDKAADDYVSALRALSTGQLKVTVPDWDADPASGSIRHIRVQAEFVVPADFRLDSALKPKAEACMSSIREHCGR